ncbi:MAG: hypothetical protein FD167_650 [bacterium]|nr:MAG: hypothetical protein FD167_650 [bacterium]
MNFDDIKNQWSAFDKKLDNSIKLNTFLLREVSLNKTNSFLRRLSLSIYVELILSFLVLMILGNFMWNNLYEIKFLIPAISLDLFVIFLVHSGIQQLIAINSIDFGEPIITNQKKLESLKVRRINETKRVFLFSPLLWVPLLIVIVRGITGLDPYAIFSTSSLVANLLFGLAVIPLVFFVSKRYSHRFQSSPLVQVLMNDIAGRSLNEAIGFLDKLSKFEKE